MKCIVLSLVLAVLATPVSAQEVAADVTPVLEENTSSIIVVIGQRPLEMRDEWREPEVVVERGMGVQQHSYTLPLGTLGNYELGFRQEWTQDTVGDNYGPRGRNDDTFRAACPTPILENCIPDWLVW